MGNIFSQDPGIVQNMVKARLVTERAEMRAEIHKVLERERAEMRAEMRAEIHTILERERAEMRESLAREREAMQRSAQDIIQRVMNENNDLRAELGRVKDAVNTLTARYFDKVHFESTEQITADKLLWLLERANLSNRGGQSCKGVATSC